VATILSTALSVAAAVIGVIPASVLLIGGAIAVLVGSWVAFTDSGRRSAAALVSVFKQATDAIRLMLGGLPGALMGARWDLAGQILKKNLELAAVGAAHAVVLALAKTLGTLPGIGDALGAGLGGSAKGLELKAAGIVAELMKLNAEGRGLGGVGGGIGPGLLAGSPASISTFSAAGAATLGFGSGNIPTKTLEEIRLLRQSTFKLYQWLREQAARRDRPGIFRD
jgi:hypothetical protein